MKYGFLLRRIHAALFGGSCLVLVFANISGSDAGRSLRVPTASTSSAHLSVFGQPVTFTATATGGSGGFGSPSWKIVSTGLPAGVYVNSMWARNRNDAFLWGSRNVPNTSTPESYLFHWDGTSWTQAFYLTGYSTNSVFGTGTSDVWVSAYQAPNGPSAVYRSTDDGVTWAQQILPPQVGNAYVGSLTGTPNNIQASAGGNQIIQFDGVTWNVLNAGGTTNNDPPGPMTIISPTEGYYTECWGLGSWDGSSWTYHPDGFDFCDVNSIWAQRDLSNDLSLYTAGNNNFSNGVRVWKFNGTNFGSKCGYDFGDPTNGNFDCNGIFCGNGSYGSATGIWGSAANDIWVSGFLGVTTTSCGGTNSVGHVYHFDGQTWTEITPTLNALVGGILPVTTTLFGTAVDDIWVPLADGRVLRYTTMGMPPVIKSLTATPNVLWPPNHKMVPVSLTIVSTGDPSPVCQVSSVTSNEPVAFPGEFDWVVTDPLTVELRAERAGSGGGRVYTITATCTNALSSVSRTVTITVPHDQGQ